MLDYISNIAYNTGSFLLIISIIVFIHEFGHYYVARLCGVKVEIFSIGMGPKLFSRLDKNKTIWQFCAIPVGGYVKMYGDENAASLANTKLRMSVQEKKEAFHSKKLSQKMAIVAAGPIANYLLAIIILTFFFFTFGIQDISTKISDVDQNSPAAIAGIKPGDIIKNINGSDVNNFNDIKKTLSLNQGEPVTVTFIRDSKFDTVVIKPDQIEKTDMFGNKVITDRLGIIASNFIIRKISPVEAIWHSFKESTNMSAMTLKAMYQIIVGKRSTQELSGPVKIAKYSGQSFKNGIHTVLWLIAILSINLAVINLLPIPMLDGGHLFFYIIEFIIGRPVSKKSQQICFQIGLFLIILLFVFVTFNDLKTLDLF